MHNQCSNIYFSSASSHLYLYHCHAYKNTRRHTHTHKDIFTHSHLWVAKSGRAQREQATLDAYRGDRAQHSKHAPFARRLPKSHVDAVRSLFTAGSIYINANARNQNDKKVVCCLRVARYIDCIYIEYCSMKQTDISDLVCLMHYKCWTLSSEI